jgi:hypothetical protein
MALLYKKGLQIIKADEVKRLTAHYWNVSIKKKNCNNQSKIDSIVFSKDRAMQLYAFLQSYEEMVSNRGLLYILYKTTNEKHKKSYLELQKYFSDKEYIFIEEIDFRRQLIEISTKSNANTVGLYVDDMIFLINVDYNNIINLDLEDYVVSLSRGKDLDEHPGKKLTLPDFTKRDDGFESFRWDYSNNFSHWTYPIGVSGYFYNREEWVVMLRDTSFKAPNTLEGNLQKYVPLFIGRTGICMHQIACVCVHANLVQTECINPIIGTFTIEELLNRWENGYKINLQEFYGKTGKVSQYQTYTFIKR